eukprot:scaffold4640_cov149-Skeletonema_menzelii.AAC.6
MSSSPPVVQALLEQFTRCFSPTCETDCEGSSGRAAKLSPRSSQHGRTSPFERLQDALRDSKHRRSADSSVASKSSNESKRSQASDVVSKAKKAAIPSPEILEEKSYKRKLEIFRTRDSPDIERQLNHPVRGRAKVSNHLVEDPPSDSSDEEIKNLTRNSSNRFACGVNMGPIKEAKPVANFAKFFNIGQDGNPFALCFATPVRAASPEDIANLSDDKLTTAEFLERHSPSAPDLVNDSLRGSDSISDDGVETVNSTLYFESKYNNFTQTRPPMPLFHCQSITVTPSKTDEISEMIKKRSEENGTSTRRGVRRRLSPKKRSTKSHEPPSPNSVADVLS